MLSLKNFSTILFTVLFLNYSYAEEIEPTPEVKEELTQNKNNSGSIPALIMKDMDQIQENTIPPNLKKINYKLQIKNATQILYDGGFELKNSTPISIINGYSTRNVNTLNDSVINKADSTLVKGLKAIENNQEVSTSIQLIVHIDKDKKSNNLWSEFFIQQANTSINKDGTIISLNNKAVGTEMNQKPNEEIVNDRTTILHLNKTTNKFYWSNLEFTISAKVLP